MVYSGSPLKKGFHAIVGRHGTSLSEAWFVQSAEKWFIAHWKNAQML